MSSSDFTHSAGSNLPPNVVSALALEESLKLFDRAEWTELRASPVCLFSLEMPLSRAIYLISGLGFSRLEYRSFRDGESHWLMRR